MTPAPTTRSRPLPARPRAWWRGAASGLQLLLFLFVLAVANSPDLHHAFAGHDHAHCHHHGEAGHDRPENDPDEGCVVRLMHSGAAEAPDSTVSSPFVALESVLRSTPCRQAEIASAETTVFDRGPPVL